MKTFLFLLLVSLGAVQASDLDFVLSNKTTRDYEALYVTAAADKDWDGNLLANGSVLAPGASVKVKFDKSANSARWDLNIVDDAGLALMFEDVDLTDVKKITVKEAAGEFSLVLE